MSEIEKLSLAPCPIPSCVNGKLLRIPGATGPNVTDTDCVVCGGAGARVPGLWKKCPGNDLRDAPAYHGKRYEYASGEDCGCQGRGWVPIPFAEVMGVLVRVAPYAVLTGPLEVGVWMAELQTPWGEDNIWGEADTPEEALAAAINQALEVGDAV